MKKIKLISAVTAFAAAASMMLAGCGTTADTNDTTTADNADSRLIKVWIVRGFRGCFRGDIRRYCR